MHCNICSEENPCPDCLLDSTKYPYTYQEDSTVVYCPNCKAPWKDRLEVLTCPCLDDF